MVRKLWVYKVLGLAVLLFSLIIVGLPALLVRGCGGNDHGLVQKGPFVRLQTGSGQIITLPLEEYLIGVVAAEMPASFHLEALKAQAIAARTYTLYRLNSNGSDKKHPDADLCTDPYHCQSWLSVTEMRKRWGFLHFASNYDRIVKAVTATSGEVLVYNGRLIDAVYHSSCGGKGTEDAAEVWGRDVPYLKGVACRWDAPEQQQLISASIPLKEFFNKLGVSEDAVPVSGGFDFVQVLERTSKGRVKRLQVGSLLFQGPEFRKALGLRSTDFTVRKLGSEVVFLTRGYGHAVGLCQYGANGLALRGENYKRILLYYYKGVKVSRVY